MRSLLAPVLALAALCASGLAQTELRYAPEDGAVLRRNFEVRHFLAVTRSVTRTEGLEELGQRSFDLRNVEKLQASDRILKVEGGRPVSFRRYFDRGGLDGFAELSGVGGAVNLRAVGISRLKGKSVMFSWIPEDALFGRYFDAAEGVEEDLRFMREDLDLRAFLPDGPVEVGAPWSVAPTAMGDALSPGGMLTFDFSKSKNISLARTLRLGTGSHLFELFKGEVEGEVTASLKSVEVVEEVRLAVVAVEWDVKTTTDLTDLARRNRAAGELQFDKEMIGMDVTLLLKGEGTFRWDLENGHLADYDFSSAEDVHSSVRSRVGEKGKVREELLEMGGRVVVTGKVERRDR
jgi:hypothetical protein